MRVHFRSRFCNGVVAVAGGHDSLVVSVSSRAHVQERIGAGGMGEVYRAGDIRPGRDAVLKVLPIAFTADPDRRARFEREARVLAALNHPNIATIHGIEDSNSSHER